jgi:predicted naringenin-chalcone synthase
VDVVGMGCNAGLNGLQVVSNWCESNPNKIAALVCCEMNSCIYTLDTSPSNALVNSLFGDGIAVAIVKAQTPDASLPSLRSFGSHLIPNTLGHLTFNWDTQRHLYAFYIDKETPTRLGSSVRTPIEKLLAIHELKISDVKHWVLHGGGEAILSSIQSALQLPPEALRHSRSVLRDFGNVASGSFLFSYERLLAEKTLTPGDIIVLMTLGPGLSLDMSLMK